MDLDALHSSLTPQDLDRIIKKIKPDIKQFGFSKAIFRQMKRFGFGDSTKVFRQISGEMRKRSAASRKARPPKVKGHVGKYNDRLSDAIKMAYNTYRSALTASDEIDDVDQIDYVYAAADKYAVKPDDILKRI